MSRTPPLTRTRVELDTRASDLAKSGEVRPAPPRDNSSASYRRRPARPTNPGRPIRDTRPRLDPAYSFARDRTIVIQWPRAV